MFMDVYHGLPHVFHGLPMVSPDFLQGSPLQAGQAKQGHVQGVAVHEFVDVIRGLTTEPGNVAG